MMNEIERESIILNSAWKMIDGMVNWAMFSKNDLTKPTTLLFESTAHAKLFIILLTDFLSTTFPPNANDAAHGLPAVPKDAQGADITFLFHLRQIVQNPQLGENTSDLYDNVEAFACWLEKKFTSKSVNFTSIDIIADLEVERYRYIKMCGNIAKHSLPRLTRNIKNIRNLLRAGGHEVSIQDAYLATDDFFAWYFDDIFLFHANYIVEFLNDIRWAVFEYLHTAYKRSWYPRNRFHGDYGYNVPELIADPVAQAMYLDLMNRVGRKPYMPRFAVDEAFKRPHWSEV